MSPRTTEQFKELRDASKQKIFDAALELFGTKGFASTSIADIVKAAGISKGLLYHYFSSKDDLLEQLVGFLLDSSSQKMEAFGEKKQQIREGEPKVRLKAMLDLFFLEMRENYRSWSLILSLTVQVHHFEFIHQLALQKARGYVVLMTDLFDQLEYEDPKGEAMLLGALFDGIGMQYYVLKDEKYLEEIERSIYEKYKLT
ncbi:MAG: TetR/AcrR family transcriptional regulator [Cyclobacteriaceae bacterium]